MEPSEPTSDSAESPEEPEPPGPEPVRPDSLLSTVLYDRPDARRVMWEEFGLPCYRCEVRYSETVAQGISYRKLDVEAVVARLNRCPPRVSEDAAPA